MGITGYRGQAGHSAVLGLLLVLGAAWFTAPADAQPAAGDAVSLVTEGRRHIAEGDAAGALRLFEEAIASDPNHAEALFFAGFLYVQAERLQEGISALTRSVELSPERYRVRLLLAKTQERIGATEEALREYRRVIVDAPAGAPEADEARQHIGVLETLRAQTGESFDEADTVELRPDTDVNTLMAVGRQRLSHADPEGALEAFEFIRAQQPDDAEVLFFIGNINLQLNRVEPGLRALEQSLELTPNNYRLRLVLAKAYERFATQQEALHQLRIVAALAPPGASEALEAAKEIERLSKQGVVASQAGEPTAADDPVIATLDNVSDLLNEARARMARGDHTGALRAAQAAQSLEPSHAEALYFIGNLELQLGNVENGLRALARSAALVPENYRVRLVLARGHDRFSAPEEALREYRLVIAAAPAGAVEAEEANKRARLLSARIEARQAPVPARQQFLGLLREYAADNELLTEILRGYVTDNDVEGAQHLLEALVEQYPDQVRLRSYLLEIYERTEQAALAIAQYDDLLALLPPESDLAASLHARALMLKGTLAIQERNFTQARDYFQELYALHPEDIGAGINLAVAYHSLDEKTQAEAILKDLAARHPSSPDVHLRLATLYLEQTQLEEGARELEEARIVGGNSRAATVAQQLLTSLYAGETGAQLQQKAHDALIQERREHIAADPDNYAAWSSLSTAAQMLNRLTDLRDAYENMLRLRPEEGMTYARQGELYDTLAEYKLAEDAYRHALEFIEGPAELKALLDDRLEMAAARRAFSDNAYEEAEQRFRALTERKPDDYISHFYLAMLLAFNSRLEEAAQQYEEVIRITPTHGAAHLSLGMLYEQLRREEDALLAYRTALSRPLPGGLDVTARERLTALAQRLDGFSYTLSYQSGYDSNFNLSRDDEVKEFRSSVSAGMTYRRKLHRRPIYLGIGLSGSYQTFHRGQFDVFYLGVNPFLSVYWKGLDFSLSLSQNEGEALMSETKLNTTNSANAGVSGSFTMPRLLSWLGDGQTGSGLWDFSVSASRTKSETSPIFDANNYTVGGTINQGLGTGWRWTLGYNFSRNENLIDAGNDFAYTGHSVSVQLIRFLRPGLSANGGYSTSYMQYTNPDSVTLFTRKRENFTQNLSLGMNYFLSSKLRLFSTLSYRFNESNLPTGFILSPEDAATAIGLQSSSLGDYSSLSVSAGLAFSF